MASLAFQRRRGNIWDNYQFEGKSFDFIRKDMDRISVAGLKKYDDVYWEAGECAGIPGKWVRSNGPANAILYYIHGGGFTLGSSGIALPFVMELCHRLGLESFSPDYRLAPEHTFPTAPNDVFQAYQGLLAMGYPSDHIIVCGESAGATLSLDIPLMARMAGVQLPKAVVALSPLTDATCEHRGEVQKGLNSSDEVMRVYAPGVDLKNPLISPAYGDLENYPPVFLSAGGTELLMEDALIFAYAAGKHGCDVRLHVGRGVGHTYPLELWDYPEAMHAFEEISLFIRQQMETAY